MEGEDMGYPVGIWKLSRSRDKGNRALRNRTINGDGGSLSKEVNGMNTRVELIIDGFDRGIVQGRTGHR